MSSDKVFYNHCLEIVKRRHPDWSLEKQKAEAQRINKGFKKELKTGVLDMSLREPIV